jgi:methyltransferase-like protein/SAM-dependent methyltransferase
MADTSYDEIPYESEPVYQTHPDALCTAALLSGMQPAPVERCRVLELGCASGGNLAPMAATLPDSRFVGVDLSPAQIADGQARLLPLGLGNLELRAMSIVEVDERLGEFDYILCHGVYSWVSDDVQEKILDLCARQLAPEGVAYISYNTFPGWHRRAMVREMLAFHVRPFADATERVRHARAFLDFLPRALPEPDGLHARLVGDEAKRLLPLRDDYLFHEHLEAVNQPIYFHQFAARARAKGLQYLGESCQQTTLGDLRPEVAEGLARLGDDPIAFEQYVDFVRNRMFRRSLVCRAERALSPHPEVIERLRVGALARPIKPRPSLEPGVDETFQTETGSAVTTDEPRFKALLLCLFEAWPRSLPFAELGRALASHLGAPLAPAPLAEMVLECYGANLLALGVHQPRLTVALSERPLASALARLQAQRGARVANLNHRVVELSELDRVVLQQLDGTRDREALVERLAATGLEIKRDGRRVDDPAERRRSLADALEPSLRRLAVSALLVS